ncbi:KH domain-containing protein isoform X1 [Gossypium australe]|uniref:KH domain-containing protein isoform X1 n=1 Tax=Gossypium australe TaxID=47621 RepID=A0A5B6VY55_9ROSI|nr:KH domain-containing protein isoform X1 [Gossypium australe]
MFTYDSDRGERGGVPNLQMQAMMQEMRRMLQEGGRSLRTPSDQEGEASNKSDNDGYYGNDDEKASDHSVRKNEQRPRERRDRERIEGDLGSIKLKILPFQGRNYLEAHLKWEKKIESMFDCHNSSELKKAKLIAIEFTNYALIWWNQLTLSKR